MWLVYLLITSNPPTCGAWSQYESEKALLSRDVLAILASLCLPRVIVRWITAAVMYNPLHHSGSHVTIHHPLSMDTDVDSETYNPFVTFATFTTFVPPLPPLLPLLPLSPLQPLSPFSKNTPLSRIRVLYVCRLWLSFAIAIITSTSICIQHPARCNEAEHSKAHKPKLHHEDEGLLDAEDCVYQRVHIIFWL